MRNLQTICCFAALLMATAFLSPGLWAAVIDDAADLPTQQAQEKQELEEMKREMGDVRSNIRDGLDGIDQLQQKLKRAAVPVQEVHLIAKESTVEVVPGVSLVEYTYNGQQPGPTIRVQEGQPVRIVLHNQLKVPTSLCFHGVLLPHGVGGLPRKDAGLVAPGQTYAFQFVPTVAGTFWYHPQVIHADQYGKGLCGALVVEPTTSNKSYERDVVLMLGQATIPTAAGGKTYFTVNGKSAPAIPPIEVKNGERVRLRVINTCSVPCPLYLTGHKFDVASANGADGLEPHITRDTVTLQPGDRYDLDFVANNPGVWSLASLLPTQTSNDGKFPGGIAVVVRYPDAIR